LIGPANKERDRQTDRQTDKQDRKHAFLIRVTI